MDGEGALSKGRVGWVSNLAGCLEGTDGVESDGGDSRRTQPQQGQEARTLDKPRQVSEGRDPGMGEADCRNRAPAEGEQDPELGEGPPPRSDLRPGSSCTVPRKPL